MLASWKLLFLDPSLFTMDHFSEFHCVNIPCILMATHISVFNINCSGCKLPLSHQVSECNYLQLNTITSKLFTILHILCSFITACSLKCCWWTPMHPSRPSLSESAGFWAMTCCYSQCLLLAYFLLCAPRELCTYLWCVSYWHCGFQCGFSEANDYALLEFKFSSLSRVQGTW